MIDRELYRKMGWAEILIDQLETGVMAQWNHRKTVDNRKTFKLIQGGKI